MMLNSNVIKGRWKQFKGLAKQEWGALTDNEALEAEGDYEEMCGKIQARYGVKKEEVGERVNKTMSRLNKKVKEALN